MTNELTNTSFVLEGNPFKGLASTASSMSISADPCVYDAGNDDVVVPREETTTTAAAAVSDNATSTAAYASCSSIIPPSAPYIIQSPSSFVVAETSAEFKEEDDIENQQQEKIDETNTTTSSTVGKTLLNASTAANIGIFAEGNDNEDDTASVFSFDSLEQQPRIPLRVQNMIRKQQKQQQLQQQQEEENNNDVVGFSGSEIPFPSVVGGAGTSMEYENNAVVNVCPCRCLFFTLKETICLIMSALGCAVFLTGLILLCMFLEGSAFNDS